MSDVLHHARLTPTHQSIVGRRSQFLADINARAEALKPKPAVVPIVTVQPEVQPVPVQTKVTASELAERISHCAQELKELRRINASLMRREFGDINGHPPVKEIQRAVSAYYSITMLDIQSHRRLMSIVLPRQIAMYLARTMTLLGSPQIARKFGNRDHTTVLHAVSKITKMLPTHPKLALEVASIKASIVPLRKACSEQTEGTPCNLPQTTMTSTAP